MISQWVANTLSSNGISVEFVGLFDPVDMAYSIPDNTDVIGSNVKNEMIIGPVDFTGQPIFNPDYWTLDFDWIAFYRMGMYGRISTSSGSATVVDRVNLNASHGAIGGLPGFNDDSENTVTTSYGITRYDYSIDTIESYSADRYMRNKIKSLEIFISILEYEDYKFPSVNPTW